MKETTVDGMILKATIESRWYLDGHDVKRCITPDDLSRSRKQDRLVERTQVGDAVVSTVFLGYPSGFSDLLWPSNQRFFETRVFGGSHDGDADTARTWDEAVDVHEAFVSQLMDDGGEG